MPGWRVSSLNRNNHITVAHESAANAVKSGADGGMGLFVPFGPFFEGSIGVARGRKEAITRETTYKTI